MHHGAVITITLGGSPSSRYGGFAPRERFGLDVAARYRGTSSPGRGTYPSRMPPSGVSGPGRRHEGGADTPSSRFGPPRMDFTIGSVPPSADRGRKYVRPVPHVLYGRPGRWFDHRHRLLVDV